MQAAQCLIVMKICDLKSPMSQLALLLRLTSFGMATMPKAGHKEENFWRAVE